MQHRGAFIPAILLSISALSLSACSTTSSDNWSSDYYSQSYTSRMPQTIASKEKTIVVDPNVHAWGAYDNNGKLVRAGQATAGNNWCPDINRPCKTGTGQYRIKSLGSADCKSSKYPINKGGAPMPYCMYFNGSQGLHGSNEVVDGNVSHGCVRLHVGDAEWIRNDFANVGTKVVVKSY